MNSNHVHLVGVSGTGMGALATLFRERGARVTGSDVAFDAPIGPALRSAGVECLQGFDARHLDPAPNLVVVGNAIRKGNVEAAWAEEHDLARSSMSAALRDHFLRGRRTVVVCGTHGKTTTSSIVAWLLAHAGLQPGYFIGGIPQNFGAGAAIGRAGRSLTSNAAPFVVEGDEYDAVYWNKQPKFLDYVGASDQDETVIVTSIEHDHIDIYPTEQAYEDAFVRLFERVSAKGLFLVDASQARALELARKHARARVIAYGLDPAAEWSGAVTKGGFDLFAGGSACGHFSLALPGEHNVRNALAAIAACAEAFGVAPTTSRAGLATFAGVKRRQELLGAPGGIDVYDDFAHHPTAVDETLRALRKKHPSQKLIAVFEPRSATACRSIHQGAYVGAFAAADRVILAPLGRANVPEGERLDVARLARELGDKATAEGSVDAIVKAVVDVARKGDVVAILSNGAFGGLHQKILDALAARANVEDHFT